MVLRYSGSAGLGFVVTAALIYWMQLLIAGGELALPGDRPIRLFSPPRIEAPPVPRQPRQRPERPEPRSAPPELETITPSPTTAPAVRGRRAMPPRRPGPPGLPGGRQGPWISDAQLVPVSRVPPLYPHAAITRELEGYVTVEFTVLQTGAVGDISIIESSHTLFERAAISAVSRYRYQPRIVDGSAVEVTGIRTRLEFRLDD